LFAGKQGDDLVSDKAARRRRVNRDQRDDQQYTDDPAQDSKTEEDPARSRSPAALSSTWALRTR